MAYYVVTGGGGFVGKALVRRLRAEGHRVCSISRGNYPELATIGAEICRGDLADASAPWASCFAGAAAVFHTAAHVEMWGRLEDFRRTNVLGTKNVIAACRAHSVPVLVYTSSPSVVADGTDLCGVDESYPYPKHYEAFYPQTKAEAEREVLAAHGDAFRTVALRPHLIFGPGDTNLIPTVLAKARAGRLVQIGEGKNLSDFTYIDDCVEAHLCAAREVGLRREVGGRPYFISQGDPVPLWEWINRLLRLHGLPPVHRRVPFAVARALAAVCEGVCRILPGMPEPPLTRFLVSEMYTSHYFNIGAARRDLGYQPRGGVWERLEGGKATE